MEPCKLGKQCRNSPENAGEEHGKCYLCRYSPSNSDVTNQYWSPTKEARTKHIKHPTMLYEKRLDKVSKDIDKYKRKANRDKTRRKVVEQAAQAERTTEKRIIRATKNSGRSFKDGDHIFMEDITLDTKNQSTRINPIVNLAELEKVRADATRAGRSLGALVLRSKNGIGVMVIHESDWPKLIMRTREDESTK